MLAEQRFLRTGITRMFKSGVRGLIDHPASAELCRLKIPKDLLNPMQLVLDSPQIEAARLALTDPVSDQLLELVFRLNLGRPVGDISSEAFGLARQLGWVESKKPALTALGYLVADPIREYRFWLERGRRLHSEHQYSLLARESYRGKTVLEIGCGFGCNLFSLAGLEGRFVGVEPMALYRQFTPLLAEREGIIAPEIVDGRGEALPFPEPEFDVVLCYSAHQYMDIRPALKEMARVLRPGGQLQIVGGTIGPYLNYVVKHLLGSRKWGSAKGHLLTVLNTITYSALGRRLYVPTGNTATAAPVYPPAWSMSRWLNDTGLLVRTDLFRRIDGETCFVAEKPISVATT